MRKLAAPSAYPPLLRWKSIILHTHRLLVRGAELRQILPTRNLAQVRPEPLSELWFTSSSPRRTPADELLGTGTAGQRGADHKPPDERTLKLGESMPLPPPL